MNQTRTLLAILATISAIIITGLLIHWYIFAAASRASIAQTEAVAKQIEGMRELTTGLRAEIASLRADVLAIGNVQRSTQQQPPASISNNATMEGSTVNVGGEAIKRDWLKASTELRTRDLAYLLDVTNETVTDKIIRESDGTLWFPHGGKRWPVRAEGNTFYFANPFQDKE